MSGDTIKLDSDLASGDPVTVTRGDGTVTSYKAGRGGSLELSPEDAAALAGVGSFTAANQAARDALEGIAPAADADVPPASTAPTPDGTSA